MGVLSRIMGVACRLGPDWLSITDGLNQFLFLPEERTGFVPAERS